METAIRFESVAEGDKLRDREPRLGSARFTPSSIQEWEAHWGPNHAKAGQGTGDATIPLQRSKQHSARFDRLGGGAGGPASPLKLKPSLRHRTERKDSISIRYKEFSIPGSAEFQLEDTAMVSPMAYPSRSPPTHERSVATDDSVYERYDLDGSLPVSPSPSSHHEDASPSYSAGRALSRKRPATLQTTPVQEEPSPIAATTPTSTPPPRLVPPANYYLDASPGSPNESNFDVSSEESKPQALPFSPFTAQQSDLIQPSRAASPSQPPTSTRRLLGISTPRNAWAGTPTAASTPTTPANPPATTPRNTVTTSSAGNQEGSGASTLGNHQTASPSKFVSPLMRQAPIDTRTKGQEGDKVSVAVGTSPSLLQGLTEAQAIPDDGRAEEGLKGRVWARRLFQRNNTTSPGQAAGGAYHHSPTQKTYAFNEGYQSPSQPSAASPFGVTTPRNGGHAHTHPRPGPPSKPSSSSTTAFSVAASGVFQSSSNAVGGGDSGSLSVAATASSASEYTASSAAAPSPRTSPTRKLENGFVDADKDEDAELSDVLAPLHVPGGGRSRSRTMAAATPQYSLKSLRHRRDSQAILQGFSPRGKDEVRVQEATPVAGSPRTVGASASRTKVSILFLAWDDCP